MQNPLRSEAEAFRFLIVVIAGSAVIVAAAYINTWLGVAAAVLVVAGVARWYWRQPSPRPPRLEVHDDTPHARRILVVANETVGGRPLREEVAKRAQGSSAEILVVAPALNSPVKHWVSDEDGARAAAQQRVDASVARLAESGVSVRGEVGDAEPLQAIEDALRTFGADEIVLSTHPEGRSNWLEQGLVEEARRRFALPITHVVVDLEAEREEVR
ncbi:MAG TPA: universal stress protein [Gaiellaceae bacterium]|nr:universal stress protein [Gaiellaceae bacterium]